MLLTSSLNGEEKSLTMFRLAFMNVNSEWDTLTPCKVRLQIPSNSPVRVFEKMKEGILVRKRWRVDMARAAL